MELEAEDSTKDVPNEESLLHKGILTSLFFNQFDKILDIAVGVEWFRQKDRANWFAHVMFFAVAMANFAEVYTFQTDSVLSKRSTITSILAGLGLGPLAYVLQVWCMKYQNLENWRLQEVLRDMKFSYFLLEVCPSITIQFFVIKHHSEKITPLLIIGSIWSTIQVFVCVYMIWTSLHQISSEEREGALALAFLFMVPSVSITLGLCYAGRHWNFNEGPHLIYIALVTCTIIFAVVYFFQTFFEDAFTKFGLFMKRCYQRAYDVITCVAFWEHLEQMEERANF